MKKRSIRGFEIEIGIEVFGKTLFFTLAPLTWRKPLLSIPKKGALMDSPHMYCGPFHIWLFSSGATIGLTFDLTYNPFFWDSLTVPKTSKRII